MRHPSALDLKKAGEIMPFTIDAGGGAPPAPPKPQPTILQNMLVWLLKLAEPVIQQAVEIVETGQVPLPSPPPPPAATPPTDAATTQETQPKQDRKPPSPPDIGMLQQVYEKACGGDPLCQEKALSIYGGLWYNYLYSEISADGNPSDDVNDILDEFESGESQSSLLIALRDQPELVEAVLEMSPSPETALGVLFAYEQDPAILSSLLEPLEDDNNVLSLSMLGLPGDFSSVGDPSNVEPPKSSEEAVDRFIQAIGQVVSLEQEYGVTLTVQTGYPGSREGMAAWLAQPARIGEAYYAVVDTASALQRAVEESSSSADPRLQMAPYVPSDITGAELFQEMMGPIELQLASATLSDYPKTSAQVHGLVDLNEKTVLIQFFPIELGGLRPGQFIPSRENIVHEFGHVLNVRTGGAYAQSYAGKEISALGQTTDYEQDVSCSTNINSGLCRQNLTQEAGEEWADRFLFWVYDGFNDPARKYQADQWMADVVSVAYGHQVAGNKSLVDAARTTLGYAEDAELPTGTIQQRANPLLRLRKSPAVSGEILSNVEPGTSVSILGVDVSGEWVLVAHDGQIGWMSKEYIDMSDATSVVVDQELMNSLTARRYDDYWNRIPASLTFPPPDVIP